jgi:hypothetical protein
MEWTGKGGDTKATLNVRFYRQSIAIAGRGPRRFGLTGPIAGPWR